MVAGAREGEGAVDVVWVRDCAERDLSRNSTMDWTVHERRRLVSSMLGVPWYPE